jgi:hypothetical protein
MNVRTLIGIVLLCLAGGVLKASRIQQAMYYNSPQANQVFLIWDCKDFCPDKDCLPAGSYVKDEKIYSPMSKTGSIFSVRLNLPSRSEFHYSFWITKGPGDIDTDVLDDNSESGGAYAGHASSAPVIVSSKATIQASEKLSLLNYSRQFLIAVALLFIIVTGIRYMYLNNFLNDAAIKNVLAITAGGLLVLLFLIRPALLGVDWDVYNRPFDFAPQLLWTGFYDLVYVAVLTGIFLLLVLPFRRFPQVQFGMAYLFIAISLFSMIAGIINVRLLEALGKPSIYRWMYNRDLLNRAGASVTLPDNVSTEYVMNVIVLCFAVVVAGAILISLLGLLVENDRVRKLLIVFSTFLCVSWVVVAQEAISFQNWKPGPSSKVSAFLGDINPVISGNVKSY